MTDTASLEILRLAGRCANGAERGGGVIWHAVPAKKSVALCGRTHGRRSAGWSGKRGAAVTCPRCLRKLATQKVAA